MWWRINTWSELQVSTHIESVGYEPQWMHSNPNLHRLDNPVFKRSSEMATMICPLEMLALTDYCKTPTNQKSD